MRWLTRHKAKRCKFGAGGAQRVSLRRVGLAFIFTKRKVLVPQQIAHRLHNVVAGGERHNVVRRKRTHDRQQSAQRVGLLLASAQQVGRVGRVQRGVFARPDRHRRRAKERIGKALAVRLAEHADAAREAEQRAHVAAQQARRSGERFGVARAAARQRAVGGDLKQIWVIQQVVGKIRVAIRVASTHRFPISQTK